METANCLNCNQALSGNYCTTCGQKSSTHRLSLKHFFLHDFVHGVFHLDKGFLYTIKELFTRPGHSIREYIQGKRVKHFNYFTLLIVLATISHLVGAYSNVQLTDMTGSDSKGLISGLEQLGKTYPKLFALSQIPFLALLSYVIFKKSNQNYSEHLILNTFKASAEVMLSMFVLVVSIFYANVSVISFLYLVMAAATIMYEILFYYQYFSTFGYSKTSLAIRSVLAAVSFPLITALITFLAVRGD
jgi:Protein of unknown function (DUF3667)